jgi:hypothetical protein
MKIRVSNCLLYITIVFIQLNLYTAHGRSCHKSTDESYNTTIESGNNNINYDFLKPSKAKPDLHRNFVTNASYFSIESTHFCYFLNKKPYQFTQTINISGTPETLILERVEILTPGFYIRTSDGRTIYPDLTNDFQYRGRVKGQHKSWATLLISNGNLKYLIATEKGNYEINKVSDGQYAGYLSKDQINPSSYKSHTGDESLNSIRNQVNSGNERIGNCIELHFQVDFKAYQDLGSSTFNVTEWVRGLINDVAAVYALHDVPISLSELFIWTTSDPYAGLNNTAAIIDLFVNTIQNNYVGKIAQLISTRPLGGGIAYGIGGLCNSYPTYPGPFCVSTELSSTIDPFPNYSFNTYVISHEIGHVIGLRHTHACVWNNVNTQIDDCGNVNAINNNDTPEGLVCFDSNNPILPTGGGTIMSNCNLVSGIGIDLNLGFGTIPGALLYNNYAYSNCVTGTTCSGLAPVNDICEKAVNLNVTNSCSVTTFSNERATATSGPPAFSCGNPGSLINDVWFKVTIPASGSVTIETTQYPGGLTDLIIQAYSGSCNSLTSIACDDNSGSNNHALLSLTGQTPNSTIYVRVVNTGSNDEGYFNICAYDASIACHQDLTGLVAFYNSTNGATWTNKTGWDQGAAGNNCNVCAWYGVTCNELNRVISINLPNNNLSGSSISNSLTSVNFLNKLSLFNNNLAGSLPSFLPSFNFLTTLDLGNNDFSSSIPSNLGTINSLKNLYLDGNALTGMLPATLPNINLSLLYVNNNNLTGCFPSGYSEYCNKSYNFSGNIGLANGITFQTYCSNGNGGDEDGDLFCLGLGDCNDNDAAIFPGNPEVCDLKDNDCNGLIDDISSPLINTWISGSGDWNTPSNWSLSMVPLRCQNVVIAGSAGTTVTISSGIIGVARSVLVQANTNLNINNNGQLIINHGLNLVNSGSITNAGSLVINNILDGALFGINNSGMITNSSVGSITIQNSGARSISNNVSGVLTNQGSLTIDRNVTSSPSTGVYNFGMTNNSGTMTIRNITGLEVIIAPGSSFNNQVSGTLILE